ncbi:MAG TPA: 3-dehydroquinate synthase [Dehalococcoidales bacterium]|nr:3-dehydroquinate synthase [Dehalococcoidales bacterium]
MTTIPVKLKENNYEIQIGSGLLNNLAGSLVEMGFGHKAVVVTNPVVRRLYGDRLKDQLTAAGMETLMLAVPEGEAYKSLEQAGKLYEQLAGFQAERRTPIIALGGGVIGDLAGFVAATYMRGVPLIQVPTTLLAQVDSSTGGKVAVNHGHLKNNIGTFYQPALVIADILTLATLPEIEFRNGMAEVIKYGAFRDPELFELVEQNPYPGKELWEEIITRCVGIKAEIVEQDEKDLGLRNLLNFGHTVGHAIETVSNYKIRHGQAVAIGMVAAATLSEQGGFCTKETVSRLKAVATAAGLPVKIPRLDTKKILQAIQHDKKKTSGRVRFILLKEIGEAFIYDEIETELLDSLLQEMNA